jgi:uncharacterized membrane protein YeaQ/YmgE (transglycosylase-associated protein family)
LFLDDAPGLPFLVRIATNFTRDGFSHSERDRRISLYNSHTTKGDFENHRTGILMQAYSLLAWLAVGTIVGMLASVVTRRKRVELLSDIVLGMAGAIIGGGSSDVFGIPIESTIFMSTLTAIAGSFIIIIMMILIRRFF